MKLSKTKDLVLTALFIAIVFIATNIRVPTTPTGGGLVHLGTVALFVISVTFGPRRGAIAGSIGMALFNLTSDWVMWAPYTFVIRLVMGVIVGYIANMGGAGGKTFFLNIAALFAGGLWFLASAYVAQVMIFAVPWEVPLASIPGNMMQIVLALLIGLPLIALVNTHKHRLLS